MADASAPSGRISLSLSVAKSTLRLLLALVIALALFVGVALWFAQDQEVLQLRSAHAAADPEAPAYIAALVGADLTVGNSYVVLTNGDRTFAAMLDAIDGAARRISFETYIFEDGDIARRFTKALADAARRGVQVNVVLDALGALPMGEENLRALEQSGCRVVMFNSNEWFELEEVNYRTHRRILVVDGEVAFTGGVTISDRWLGDAQSPEHWRDTHVMVRGPIVRLIEGAFYESYTEEAGIVTPELGDSIPSSGRDAESIVVSSSPSGGSSELKRLYLLALAMSRRSVDISSPYFVTDDSTRLALADAVGRGVKVRVLVEGDITDARPVKYASQHAYDWLLTLGVEIYEYQPTMMHAKVMIVDGIWSMFGSANFDNRSLELNDELNIAVWSADLSSRFLMDYEADLAAARRLDLHGWRQRPVLERGREWFWGLFAEVF
jgi:cardiolipin synthase